MKKLNFKWLKVAICLLFVGLAFESCNSSGNSAIVGKWWDRQSIWTFNSDGSFSSKGWSLFGEEENGLYGSYQVKGEKLILDSDYGWHREFTWNKPDNDHLSFGNDAYGYYELERK